MISHLEKLWCALYISEGWYDSWERYKDYSLILPKGELWRQMALRHKAIGIVEYDRMLNNYETSQVENVFVFGESDE